MMTRKPSRFHRLADSRVGDDASSSNDVSYPSSPLVLLPVKEHQNDCHQIEGSHRLMLLVEQQQKSDNLLIPVLNAAYESTDPFGRQNVVTSILASCSCLPPCRDQLLKHARQKKRSGLIPHEKDKKQMDEKVCDMCRNIFHAQKYISKTLLYFTPTVTATTYSTMMEAVHVYATGTNAAMVSINGTPIVQNIPLADTEAIFFHNGMPWYGGQIMRVGDRLSLTNLHQQQQTVSAGQSSDKNEMAHANSSWKALYFVLMSTRECTCISTNGPAGIGYRKTSEGASFDFPGSNAIQNIQRNTNDTAVPEFRLNQSKRGKEQEVSVDSEIKSLHPGHDKKEVHTASDEMVLPSTALLQPSAITAKGFAHIENFETVNKTPSTNVETTALNSTRDDHSKLGRNAATYENSGNNYENDGHDNVENNHTQKQEDMNQEEEEAEMPEQVDESSPMLTLHHFSASHSLPDLYGNSQFQASNSQGIASTAGGTPATATELYDESGIFTETEEDHLTLTHTEPSIDELDEGSAVPLSSLSAKEIRILRDEYSPNSFRHALLSIALMRKERANQLQTERLGCSDAVVDTPGLDGSDKVVLPALLRDTVVVARRKIR